MRVLPIAEFADEGCSDDESDIEQRVEQHDILDGETGTIRTQEQEAETEIGECENPRRDKVAFEPGA
jgi:hypothetical protein